MTTLLLLVLAPGWAAALATGQPRPALGRGGMASPLGAGVSIFSPQPHVCRVMPRSRDVRMEEAPFWENVVRFMRFGISSVAGLILGLLAPFAAVFGRSPILAAVGASIGVGVLAFFYLTLSAMETPPTEAIGLMPIAEPSVEQMMADLYGK